jgi:hypothetical protein
MDDEMKVESAAMALVPVAGSSAPPLGAGALTVDLPVLVIGTGPAAAFVSDVFFTGGSGTRTPAPPTRERFGSTSTGAPPTASKTCDV